MNVAMLPAHLHEGNAAAGSGYPISLSPRGSPQIPRRQQSLTDLEGRIGGVAGGSSRTITSAASFVSDFASFRRNMGHAAVVDGMHTGGAQTLPKQKRMQSRMLSDDAGDGIFERVSIRSDGGGQVFLCRPRRTTTAIRAPLAKAHLQSRHQTTCTICRRQSGTPLFWQGCHPPPLPLLPLLPPPPPPPPLLPPLLQCRGM